MTTTEYLRIKELKKSILKGEIQLEELSTKEFKELNSVLKWSYSKEAAIIKKMVKIAMQRNELNELL